MIRDIVIWVSEALFWLTNGVPIVYTFWFVPWIMIGSVIMISPLMVFIYGKSNRSTILAIIMMVFVFFPAFVITMAPGMAQKEMMMQCEMVEIRVSTDRVESGTINARQCRTRDNFYDDFGEWTVR